MIINFSDEPVNENKKSIFLAGPTLRNSTFEQSWRKQATEILKELGFDGVVYVPEFSKKESPFDLTNQASWERKALLNASVIVFYIPRKLPELPGFTTNVEFGMYLSKKPKQVLLCCPFDSEKNSYLEWLYNVEKPNATIFRTLEEVLNEAVKQQYLNHLSDDIFTVKYRVRSTGRLFEINPLIDDSFFDAILKANFRSGEYILISGELPEKWR